jgi:hypothetical protein
MAITIFKQPQLLTPTYNPMIISVNSNLQTQESFQFVADITVRGNLVTTMKVPVNPQGFGVFDIQRHVENEISFDFNPTVTGIQRAQLSGATYSVNFKEEYRYFFNFVDNSFVAGGFVGFYGIPNGPQPVFVIGDEIVIEQTSPTPTNPQYNGLATITNISQITVGGSQRWLITTNKPFGASSPQEGGKISLSNFRLTQFPVASTVTKRDAFNGVLDFYDELSWNNLEYMMSPNGEKKFLTNIFSGYKMFSGDKMWLNFYQRDFAVVRLAARDDAGNTIYINNSFTTVSNDLNRLLRVAVGPAQILPIFDITFPSLTPVSFYDIWLEDVSGERMSEELRFIVKDKCSRYEKIQLVFMDKLGSFIPYTFNMVNKHNVNITKSNYQQIYGRYAPASQNWVYNSWDRGKKSLDTVVVERFTINSDWMDQETSDLMITLAESPEVYWIKEDGLTVAINLTVNDVERKQTINDQIVNYTMTFELSNKNNKQRG